MKPNFYKISAFVLAFVLFFSSSCGQQKPKDNQEKSRLKIGAILPLTGSASLAGKEAKQGMEIAKEELQKEGIDVDIIYEDSQAQSSVSVSAYQKLKDIDKVNVVVSALSVATSPLLSLSERDSMPLVAIISAGGGFTGKSPYIIRFSHTAERIVDTQFKNLLINNGYKNIGFIYTNDDYGTSVNGLLADFTKEKGIEMSMSEPVDFAATDFRTQLTKFIGKKPDALLFTLSSPAAILNLVKQFHELDVKSDLVEASLTLADKKSRGEMLTGIKDTNIYTLALSSTLETTGQDFIKKYQDIYKEKPYFVAPFGYDTIKLIAKATNGEKMSGKDLVNKILELKTFDSLNGRVDIQPNGEINPTLYAAKIVNDEPVLVK